jgi:hypothetical protein
VALREFDDDRGREWKVWEVHPTIAARLRNRGAAAPLQLRPEMAEGWLAFEAEDGDHRRLSPIPDVPDGWVSASLDQLRAWCALAAPVRPRRPLD